LFVRWARDDQKQAKEIDRELDAQENELVDADSPGVTKPKLWWENDPVLSERFQGSQNSSK
jgi:hypothetical protein